MNLDSFVNPQSNSQLMSNQDMKQVMFRYFDIAEKVFPVMKLFLTIDSNNTQLTQSLAPLIANLNHLLTDMGNTMNGVGMDMQKGLLPSKELVFTKIDNSEQNFKKFIDDLKQIPQQIGQPQGSVPVIEQMLDLLEK